MSQSGASKLTYNSYEEFRRAFYPESVKAQSSKEREESYARDLAKYAVERHFPANQQRDESGQ